MNCPSLEKLATVLEPAQASEAEGVAKHAADCAACQRELAALRELVASLSLAAADAPGAAVAAAAELRGEEFVQRVLTSVETDRQRPQPHRGRPVVLAASAAAAAAAIAIIALRTPTASSVVAFTKGSVEVSRAGNRRPARAGEPLAAGDGVVTADGQAEVRLGDRALASLDPRSELKVDGNRGASLERGRVAFEVEPGRAPFRIKTPAGDVVVVGTSFDVEILSREQLAALPIGEGTEVKTMFGKVLTLSLGGLAAAGTVAVVHVSRGQVRAESGGAEVALAAGDTAAMASGQKPRVLGGSPTPAAAGAAAANLAIENARLRADNDKLRAELAAAKVARAPSPKGAHGAIAIAGGNRQAGLHFMACEESDELCFKRLKALHGAHGEEPKMTDEERKLVKEARQKAWVDTASELRAIAKELTGVAPPEDIERPELLRTVFEALPPGEMLRAGARLHEGEMPPLGPDASAAERVMRALKQQHMKVREELGKTLPAERAEELSKGGERIAVKALRFDEPKDTNETE